VLYGFVVEASIGKGTIRSIDTRAAEEGARRRAGSHHHNAPAQGTGNHRESASGASRGASNALRGARRLRGRRELRRGQGTAYLVDVKYDRTAGNTRSAPTSAKRAFRGPAIASRDSAIGDFAGAFANAECSSM